MKNILIASVAHAINAAYCASIGELQPAWEDAPEWQRESVLAGVEMHIANPDATPEQSHEDWLVAKISDGWTYGEVKDAEKKQHPCCVPYADLPPHQKSKDYLFRAVVHALKDIPDAEDAVAEFTKTLSASTGQPATRAPTAREVATAVSGLAIEYIGRRDCWVDNIYGTGLSFVAGQIRVVPGAVGRSLLRHPDLFKEADSAIEEEDAPADDTDALLKEGAAKKAARDTSSLEFAVIDQINQMDKTAVADFAMNKYQIKLNKTKKVETLRQEAAQLVTRFGAV